MPTYLKNKTAVENAEQKTSNVTSFIRLVKKYESFTELTPEIMHELIDKIVVHSPDKSSGHRTQQVDIYYRFKRRCQLLSQTA